MNNYNFTQLNDNQKKAVIETEGYVRVIAGPGSGKTMTLISRYEYLINLGIPINNILCITFTNKAANTMKNRLKKIYGNNFNGYIFTFHGFANWILRREISKLNFPLNFNIFDEYDIEQVYKDIYETLNISKNTMTYKEYSKKIHCLKLECLNEYIEYITNIEFNGDIKTSNEVKEYLKYQRKNYFLDFNDLIYFTIYLFLKFPDEMRKYQKQFEYVLVDEFQDITPSEFHLSDLISQYHKNLFVVGDPDQRIYTWRGAGDFLTTFHEDNNKTFILDKNYRSTPDILNLSNSLIEKNTNRIDKKMVTDNKSLGKPVFNHFKSNIEEGNWICEEIKKLQTMNVDLNEIGILYRANRNSRFIEESLLKNNIPFKIYGDISFYERKEIKDLIAYLRFLIHKDDFSFKRIINTPSRGFGKKKMEYLYLLQKQEKLNLYDTLILHKKDDLFKGANIDEFISVIDDALKNVDDKISNILSVIYKKSGYEKYLMMKEDEERLENVKELLDSIKNIEDTYGEKYKVSDYLQDIVLLTNKLEDNYSSVKIMTVHNAKGLEFDYVFVCALSEGTFPSVKAINPEDIEEERRIAYVAFTRARKRLFLSDSLSYLNQENTSRFIYDIDKSCINFLKEPIFEFFISNNNGIKHNDTITVRTGDTIEHKIFGRGTVIDTYNNYLTIKFNNFDTPRTIKNSAGILKLVSNNNVNKQLNNYRFEETKTDRVIYHKKNVYDKSPSIINEKKTINSSKNNYSINYNKSTIKNRRKRSWSKRRIKSLMESILLILFFLYLIFMYLFN